MPAYVIDPKVLINNVEYKDKSLIGVTVSAGRTNVDEQPRAGFANIVLTTADNTYPSIEIDQEVVVKIDTPAGVATTIWRGWVSDIETRIPIHGETGWLNEQRITAIGTLAKLNRRRVGAGGYAKEFDGTRVYNIVYEAAGITWTNYTPATDTWADVNSLLTWQEVDINIGDIDQPGDFELHQYTGGATSGLNLAQQAALSGLGILYESADGAISYDDYTSRTDEVSANGFTAIEAAAIIAPGLGSVSRLSDLINSIDVQYKNSQVTSASDADSIALYGTYQSKVTTQLENLADAEQRRTYYLDTRAYPRKTLNQITLALHLDQVSDATRTALIPLTISKPISIDSLPTSVYPNEFFGFVEGYTWTIGRNELFLTLIVSEYGLSQLEMNWLQVPPTLEWQDVSATIEWQEARVVA